MVFAARSTRKVVMAKKKIEFFIANAGDYPGFQFLLRSLNTEEFNVEIILGTNYMTFTIPAIVTSPQGGAWFGQWAVKDYFAKFRENTKN